MRITFLFLLLTFCIVSVSAQLPVISSVKPEVEVLKQNWRNEIRNPALDANPFQSNMEHEQLVQDREETARLNETRIRQGLPTERTPVRVRPFEGRAPEITSIYIYEAKVKNTGKKKISAIAWEYVFFDADTKQEVGRLQFISVVDISPDKTKNLVMRSIVPPTKTLDAEKISKNPRKKYSEQILILGIEYDDGSLWKTDIESVK